MNNTKRKTKIIATVGPACNSYSKLVELYKSGVNVFRLNFSHGKHDEHEQVIQHITQLKKNLNAHVSILADLQGPKLRTGLMQNNAIELTEGETIKVTCEDVIGTKEIFSVTYENLSADLKPNELILIDDGKLELEVEKIIDTKTILCRIIAGGILSSKKGFNLPNTEISLPSLTEKDRADLDFILKQPVNWLALSFVRTAKEINELHELLHQHDSPLKIIAKVEKPEAVKNIDSIIKASDAVMIARGDLGVEVAMEEMPLIQKNIIEKCIQNSKPVIIATQVMESMIDMSRPTRAEITDVANGVLDGADAIMLSGETSVGKNPARVIQTMDKIIKRTEQEDEIYNKHLLPDKNSKTFLSDAICFNACKIAEDVNAKAINGMTYSGYTAFMLASNRPKADIHIFTSNKNLLNTLSLVWGVDVYFYDKFVSTDESIDDIIEILKNEKVVEIGDIIVSTASMPIRGKGRTNMVKINKIK
ncbi:MAG TPA: pyruvate kinase [Chitinophagales bacterium]|jgi:pyruvate kinase|nr:pyruvate kinase [Chitinophagales bacterium]MBP6154275.1 pyruvate kinase [Chitinophagales bacterium]HQV78774.1 pyruvate kinase [Chitinophagales bacterium]HQW79140.1 pyruvate kinase [Chitinophagales bacterium]HRB67083.1 pyruvate kinase [Chitinophagales bacterium]